MITAQQDYVAWAGLVTELSEAQEHLAALIESMVKEGCVEDADFAVQLGHVFAHLNRAWNRRNQTEEVSEAQWERYSDFPKDLKPVG